MGYRSVEKMGNGKMELHIFNFFFQNTGNLVVTLVVDFLILKNEDAVISVFQVSSEKSVKVMLYKESDFKRQELPSKRSNIIYLSSGIST